MCVGHKRFKATPGNCAIAEHSGETIESKQDEEMRLCIECDITEL